jgi:hypothetical protein
MSGDDRNKMPPPLPPAVEALFVHERVPPAQPQVVRARLLARADAVPLEFPGEPPLRVDAQPRVRWKLITAAASVALVAGVAAAFQMMRTSVSSEPNRAESSPADRPAPVAPPKALEPEIGKPAALATPASAAATSGPTRRASAAGKPDDGLGELELLSRARSADVRGDYSHVLTILAEHQRIHPDGRLSEEREVLRVEALVGLGRASEARRVAARFRERFPRSVLAGKVDEILTSLP